MLSKLVSAQEAAQLLDIDDPAVLDDAVETGELRYADSTGKRNKFLVNDLVIYKLSLVLNQVGVDPQKSFRYAEAILSARLQLNEKNLMEWIENETQELFCYIADSQLARIFLRNKEDDKEVDVGAVKPVLLPITKCEINVFRVIRPVVYRARQLLSGRTG